MDDGLAWFEVDPGVRDLIVSCLIHRMQFAYRAYDYHGRGMRDKLSMFTTADPLTSNIRAGVDRKGNDVMFGMSLSQDCCF